MQKMVFPKTGNGATSGFRPCPQHWFIKFQHITTRKSSCCSQDLSSYTASGTPCLPAATRITCLLCKTGDPPHCLFTTGITQCKAPFPAKVQFPMPVSSYSISHHKSYICFSDILITSTMTTEINCKILETWN